MNLSTASKGTYWEIVSVDDEELAIKLLELGYAPGSQIHLVRKAPAGGPLTIKSDKALIIIRREDANYVQVKEVEAWS